MSISALNRLASGDTPGPALTKFQQMTDAANNNFQELYGKTGTATLAFAAIAAGASQTLTVTATGATVGQSVQWHTSAVIEAGLIPTLWVSAANTVSVRLYNATGGSITPASNDWSVRATP
jgi:hypothetical protein